MVRAQLILLISRASHFCLHDVAIFIAALLMKEITKMELSVMKMKRGVKSSREIKQNIAKPKDQNYVTR